MFTRFATYGRPGRYARGLATQVRARGAAYGYSAPAAMAAGAAAAFYMFRQERAEAAFFDFNEERVQDLETRLRGMEVALGSDKNMAFVFVKPHAAGSAKVIELLKDTFSAHGIRVTAEGGMDAQTIDEKQYIDTHYGAIASKAVSLKPSELNVPDKGKAGFQKMFGLSWDDALSQGLVFNAKDGCARLGITGDELDAKWGTLSRGETMIKFGGGFYCGKVDGIYIMNGFYMSMRSMYTTPPAKIHYMTVEWPSAALSWEDFRGKILGATNPKEAAGGSVRRLIMENWQDLGLDAEPDTGNNGVHASASPFEGLAERMNWLGADPTKDCFGRAMLSAGVSLDTLSSWTSDPQVNYADGSKGSLFDALEDLGAFESMEKIKVLNAKN